MKKVVWIINHYAGGMFFNKGGRHYWFAKCLRQEGYEPVVFCANTKHGKKEHWINSDKLWDERIAEDICTPFVFVKARAYEGNGKQRVLNMVDFYLNIKKTAKEYAEIHGKPDVIIASSVHPLTVLAGEQLAKKFKVPCVCEIRDLWPESLIEYGMAKENSIAVKLLRSLEKKLYIDADSIIFTPGGCYDYIEEQKWEKYVDKNKVFSINNGIDLEEFRQNCEKYRINDSDLIDKSLFKVIYTGSIRKANNLGLLLDTAKHVKDDRVRFLIWGDGDEKEQLEERVKKENIKNVIFKGRVEKKYVPHIVSNADLNIAHGNPSKLFRFGISFNKLFDYLAAGKPVLCDFPANYNPVIMGKAGIAVESAIPEDIAGQIEEFVKMDAGKYEEYCLSARKTAEEYDFKKLTEKLIDVINRAQE